MTPNIAPKTTANTTRRARLIALGSLTATAILLAAIAAGVLITGNDDGDTPLGRIGAGLTDQPSAGSVTTTTAPPSVDPESDNGSGPRTDASAEVAEPSDSSSAFDPCAVFHWSDFPETVQPTTDIEPEPASPKPDDVFDAACSFAYTDPTDQRRFSTLVAIGHEPTMSADPQLHQAEPAEWGGRTGTRKIGTTEHGPVCTGFIPVGETGVVGISVVTSLVPDPCVVADTLLTTLASRVP